MLTRVVALATVAGTLALVVPVMVHPASPVDGVAAFQTRQDTMKRMGRPFNLVIGRVVKGTAAWGPDTVAAAETVAAVAITLDASLFPPGSDVGESRIKQEIFAAKDEVDRLIAAVRKAVEGLVPAVKTGDRAEIAAAWTAVNNACNACHTQFRRDE